MRRKGQKVKQLLRDVEILKVRVAALEARPGAVPPPPFPAGPPGMQQPYIQPPNIGPFVLPQMEGLSSG